MPITSHSSGLDSVHILLTTVRERIDSTALYVCALLFFAPLSGLTQRTQRQDGWPVYGGTLAGQHYSSATQINRKNVSNLQVAWAFHTHALDKSSPLNIRAFFEATPVLWNGTLYFDSPFDKIFAVDAGTGKLKWSYDPKVIRSDLYMVNSRGVALWHAKKPHPGVCGSDTVLVATIDRRMIARDALTGAACPNFGKDGTVDLSSGVAIGRMDLYLFTSPPTVVGNTIVLGSLIGDNRMLFAASGAVRGFDAVTGKQKWSWEPVRWTANQHPRLSGSGNAWSILSADPKHDLVFVPTGSPSVDFYGGKRLGDNRDADSIVALRASTGQRVWAFQLVHHDLWDYDTPSEPMLFTFRKSIPAVAVTTKTDMVFVFNRLTGKPLYPIVERPVAPSAIPGEHAWPTQPFSTLPPLGPLNFTANDVHLHNAADQAFCREWINRLDNHGLFTPPSTHWTLESPGNLGGANWGSSAFDPTTSVMYTRVSMLPYIVHLDPHSISGGTILSKVERILYLLLPQWAGGDPPSLDAPLAAPDHGATMGGEEPQAGAPFTVVRQPLMTPDGTPCGPPPFGSIVATNLNTGQKLWTIPHGQMVKGEPGSFGRGGLIATGGGLLFAASTVDAYLRAYDSTTGRELWRGKLPVSANATPMTYTWHARQYVVIAAGGDTMAKKGQSDALIAFALPSPAADRPLRTARR